MLEEIHTAPEDRRTVALIVDAGVVALGLTTFADGLAASGSTTAAVGAALATAGLVGMAWLHRRRPTLAPSRV